MNTDDTLTTIEAVLGDTGIKLPDPEFSTRCALFASQIFAEVWPSLGLAAAHRRLAIAAALLHEAGGSNARRDQHRKTYDIVRAADLPGFSEQERLIVACAARYHGGPYPNIEHAGFGEMTSVDQWIVRRLAAIGRLAAALDASRLGVIERIDVSVGERGIELVAFAPEEPAVERDSLREVEGSFLMLTQCALRTSIRTTGGADPAGMTVGQ